MTYDEIRQANREAAVRLEAAGAPRNLVDRFKLAEASVSVLREWEEKRRAST